MPAPHCDDAFSYELHGFNHLQSEAVAAWACAAATFAPACRHAAKACDLLQRQPADLGALLRRFMHPRGGSLLNRNALPEKSKPSLYLFTPE